MKWGHRAWAWAVAASTLLLLYGGVLVRLGEDWAHDDNYSHGFFIIPLAGYFAWERRRRLAAAPVRPTNLGLVLVGLGLGMLVIGVLGAELFITRMSLVAVLAGTVLFLVGWPALRILSFPMAFLLLMIPVPAIIFNQLAFPLQLLASRVGEVTLSTAGIPVLREGNIIRLAHTTLEVAEACSGIRSLVSLLTLGIVYGYFSDPRALVRIAIALSSVPNAIHANAARVAGTGIAAHYFGSEAAQGFFHTFSGWLVFIVAFLMVFGVAEVLMRLMPKRAAATPAAAA